MTKGRQFLRAGLVAVCSFLLATSSLALSSTGDVETDAERVAALAASVKKDAAGILAALKSMDGRKPDATAINFLRSAKTRVDRNSDAAELILDGLSGQGGGTRSTPAGDLSRISEEIETIRRFRSLTDQYLRKHAPAALQPDAAASVASSRRRSTAPDEPAPNASAQRLPAARFEGNVRLQLGSSSFSGVSDASQTAQNIGISGRYLVTPTSSVSINLDRNSAVRQTAYTSTRGRVGYQMRTGADAQVNAFLGFGSYADKVLVRSEHSDFTGGGSISYPLGKASFIGDASLTKRSYKLDGGNDFSGAQVNGKLRFGGSASVVDVGLRSRFQSSDVSFLNYSRLVPHIDFRKGTGRDYFSAKGEFELLTYDGDAQINNYTRARGDLIWNRGGKRTELNVINKSYANNEALSNVRLRASASARSGFRSSRNTATFVYHTKGTDAIANYIDVRSDFNTIKSKTFFESHLFGRGWLSTERVHRLDWSGAVGWRIWKIKIGPSAGIHMLVDPDGFSLKSDGNSWRAGAKAAGHFAISRATVTITARYEYTTAYNSQIVIDRTTGLVTRGAVEERHPTTLQIAGSVRYPVLPDLDIKVDVRQYDIHLDLDDTVSIGPVTNRSQTQILAGLVYRISR